MKFAPYTSGRLKTLKIGISNYSEDLTSLNVIGDVKVGTGITIDSSTGTLIGTKIEIIGGSSNEFLMADGSTSTSSFLTQEVDTLNSVLNRGSSSGIGISISGIITATTFKGALDGNAGTATSLATARNIGGVLFDGTADINLPGVNQAGNQDTSGNAGTATSLATARNIGGVLFDGTADINLPGVNQAGNQDTSGNALTATTAGTVSNAAQTNITSLGTLTSLSVDGNVSIGGTLTYEDVTNIDSVGIITARKDVHVGAGLSVVGISTFSDTVHVSENVSLKFGGNLPASKLSIGYVTGVNTLTLGASLYVSDNSTNNRFILNDNGNLEFCDTSGNTKLEVNNTGINAVGVGTFGSLDIGGDIDVDGHTNLDNVSVSGVSTFSSNINLPDNISVLFGTDDDGKIKHTGANLQIQETTGNIQITNYANDLDVDISSDDGSGGTTNYFKADGSTGESILYNYGNEKIKTTSTGVSITGNSVVSGNVTAVDGTFSGDLDVDGNVGIGSDIPSEKLDVNGTVKATRFVGSASSMTGLTGASAGTFGSSTTSAIITVNSDGKITGISTTSISGGGGGGSTDKIEEGNSKVEVVDTGTGSITFEVDGNERLLIDSDGVKQIKDGNLNILSTYIDFSGSISTPSTAAAIYRPADNTLAFSTKNDERLRITSDGDVGIAQTDPYYKLHLNFTDNTTALSDGGGGNWGGNGIRIENDSTTVGAMALAHFRVHTADWHIGSKFVSQIGAVDKSDFVFNHEGIEKLRITSAGKVGIGLTNPNAMMQIISDQNAETDRFNSSNYHLMLQNDQNDTGEAVGMGFAISDDPDKVGAAILHERSGGGSAGSLQFYTNSDGASVTERLRITSDGTINITTANGSLEWTASSGSNPFIRSIGSGQQSLEFNTGGDERLRITSDGKLEVQGTRNGALQANDDDTLKLFTKSTDNSIDRGTGITFYTHDGSSHEMGGTIQVAKENGTVDDPKSYMRFSTQDGSTTAERLRIDSTGQTTIRSTSNQTLILNNTNTNGQSSIQFQSAGTSRFIVGSNKDSDGNPDFFIFDDTNDKHRFNIKGDGKVGIGTDNPGEKLDVAGNIKTSGTIDGILKDGVTATTQSASDNSTKVATTAFVTTSANTRMPLTGGSFTGDITTKNMTPPNGVTNIDIGSSTLRYRNIFATTLDITGDVSIGGTLTYEDVTNIDSVGLVTARLGINVTAGVSTFAAAIDANGGVDISGGSGLVASTAKISDLTDNRVVVAGSDGELEDSANLTFNGSILQVSGQGVFNSVITAKTYIQGLSSNGGLQFFSDSSASTGVILDTDDHLTPTTDNVSDLGSSSLKWRNIFAKGDLYVDGDVGIGITDPSHDLDVYLDGRFNQLGQGGRGLLVGPGTNTGGFTYMGTGDMEISCAMTNKDIVFSDAVDGNQRMRLTGDTGRLGIGTNSPQERLHVHHDTGTATVLISSPTAPQIRINPNAADGSDDDRTIFGQATANSHFVSTAVAGDTVLRGKVSSNILIGTGTTERLRISSDGMVKIGTAGDPTDILDVHKDSTTAYDATDDNAQRTHSASITVRNDNGTTDTFSQLVFDTAGSNQSIARIVALRTGSASNALTFVTEHSNTKEERLRIASDGKVGIGTTNPSQMLTVRGTILKTRSDSGLGLIYLQQDGSFNGQIAINQNAGVTRVKLDSAGDSYFNGGNVGINSTAPLYKLDVRGSVGGFDDLRAPHSDTVKTYTVTVATKDTTHRYEGTGSANGYKIDGEFSPFITLTPGRTYKFDQSDSSNSGHPIKFYLEADKTTLYESGVTYNGTAGSSGAYTQIVVGDNTPVVLHYQCSAHGYMGNAVQVNSNVVNSNYPANLRDGLNVSGIVTATSVSATSFSGSGANLTGLTGVSGPATLGSATKSVEIVVDSNGRITGISETTSSGGGVTVKDEGSALSNNASTLNFVGSGVEATGTGTEKTITITSGGGVTVKDEGSALSTTATTLNFEGSGVEATGTGVEKTIAISAGGGVTVKDEGSALSTTATTLNFVGAGVEATGTGAEKTITISGGSGGSGGSSGGKFVENATGIHTLGNVGIGTTNASEAILNISTGAGVTDTVALDIQGTEGSLFSVTNNLTSGSLFSINDVSGIPALDYTADGNISLGAYADNVSIGKTSSGVKLGVKGSITEGVHIVANKVSAASTINIDNGNVHLFTTDETTTATPNITSVTGINTSLNTGDTLTVVIISKPNNAGYYAQLEIDGAAQTEEWLGGSAPSSANASGYDVNTYNIIKTGDATYIVLANTVNFT